MLESNVSLDTNREDANVDVHIWNWLLMCLSEEHHYISLKAFLCHVHCSAFLTVSSLYNSLWYLVRWDIHIDYPIMTTPLTCRMIHLATARSLDYGTSLHCYFGQYLEYVFCFGKHSFLELLGFVCRWSRNSSNMHCLSWEVIQGYTCYLRDFHDK